MKLTRAVALGALVVLTLSAAGCGGDKGSSGADPTAALTKAKDTFDAASSVHFTMATDSQPDSDAVLGADGTLTHQPAFKGEVKARYKGFTVKIPVVAVDGKVYAKLPLSLGYSAIDPSEFSAPDPADFADPSSGISGLLGQIGGLKEKGRIRNGKQVLTTYSGELPGGVVAQIIPSAAGTSDFKVVVGIDDDGRLASLQVTGDFFDGTGNVTYDIAFDDYDKNVTIKKP